jgi:pantothenate kinase
LKIGEAEVKCTVTVIRLYYAERQFLSIRDRKVPYIIGIAGSAAAGKSTNARVLQALLARWSPRPKVDLVTTDGFLYPKAVLRQWYVRRFLALRDTAFHDPRSYFRRYALLSDEEAIATALAIWERTNLANLKDNILPTRPRATLILTKGADHAIERVALRRL